MNSIDTLPAAGLMRARRHNRRHDTQRPIGPRPLAHALARGGWAAALVAALALPATATAGEGHDHGQAAPTAGGPALPRFAATSELFELVGVLDGARITLYLDRAADNQPVTDASLELEIAGQRYPAQRHDGEDHYELTLPAAPAPGVLPITATVQAGPDADLLAGELDLHAPAEASAATRAGSAALKSPMVLGGLAAAGVAVIGLVGVNIWRRRQPASAAPALRNGGAA